MKESKEKIKSRMLKNASRTWGFHDTEAEGSFDPLVGMMMGALAFELEQISGEIHNSESRVVEKLVELLTPEPVAGAYPAHGILSAQPIQSSFDIHPAYQFSLSRKIKSVADPAKIEQQNVFFTPAGHYKLFNGEVRYMATERTLFEMNQEGYKEVIAESSVNPGIENNRIWLGLEFGSDPESYQGLSLFFDLRSELHEEMFYQSLLKAKWFLNDLPVDFTNGCDIQQDAFRKQEEALFSLDYDTSAKVCSHVNRFYSKKFMTFTGDTPVKNYQSRNDFPPTLAAAFNGDALKQMKSPCVWVGLEFLQPLPVEVIEAIFCSINCFPVINRQLNKFTYSAKDQINVIPLRSEIAFFDMKAVVNTKGNTYTLKSFSRVKDLDQGSYIVRQGGVGRFDSRNAVEILNYLIELLRDENAAFTLLGADMISSNLKEMNQILSRLEQKLDDKGLLHESVSYLLVKSLPSDETVYVEFWTTNGSIANKIKPGTALTAYSGSDFRQETIKFISSSVGGRDKLDAEERLHTYRRALLSRDRVVTAEDIKALCYEHFGKLIDKVLVNKGLSVGASAGGGLTRTIEILLCLSKQGSVCPAEELSFLKEDLLIKLDEKSMNILPFSVFFK